MDFFSLDPVMVRDIERIKGKLAGLSDGAGTAGITASTNYLVRVLVRKEIPKWKRVTRREAFGQTFKSDRQRRWFFANFRDLIKYGAPMPWYQRHSPTGGVGGSWSISGKGLDQTITNLKPYARYLYGERQSRLHARIGYRKMSVIVTDNTPGMVRSFVGGVKTYIRKRGLS
jgi:hypothetical protein